MAFEDYTHPRTGRWKVRDDIQGNPRCNKGCKIKIGGSQNDVTVTCTNPAHIYENGKYDEGTDTISPSAFGSYKLSREADAGKPRRVYCADYPAGGRGGTGSWTADDNLPDEN